MPSPSSSPSAPGPLVYWNPTRVALAQVDAFTATAVAAGGVVTVNVGVYPNWGTLSYTMTALDTTATAAAALAALLTNSTDPRFQEIAWTVAGAVVTATAQTPGVPFTASSSASGGAALTHVVLTPSAGPNDAGDSANWRRNGQQQLPQPGDQVVVQDSIVSLLWNLDALAAVRFGSYTRWQNFGGAIGLPEINPSGYVEYRPTYFQFSGPPGGVLNVLLGLGAGGGPVRERYNVGMQQIVLNLMGSGSALDDYAVRLLGGNAFNVVNAYAGSLGVAMLPAETAALQNATVVNGAVVALGAGCALSGTLTLNNGSALLLNAPGSVFAQQGSSIVVQSQGGLTYPSLTLTTGASAQWASDGNIANLTLRTGAVLDKSSDARPIAISASTQDGDTTSVRDPWNAIRWGSPIVFTNAVNAGPLQVGAGRTFQVV